MSLKSFIRYIAILDKENDLISFNRINEDTSSDFDMELVIIASIDKIEEKLQSVSDTVLEPNKIGNTISKHYLGQVMSTAFHKVYCLVAPGPHKIIMILSENSNPFTENAIYLQLLHIQSVFIRSLCDPFNQDWKKINLNKYF